MPSPYKHFYQTPHSKTTGEKKATPTGKTSDLNAMTMAGLFAERIRRREFLKPSAGRKAPYALTVAAWKPTA